MLVWFFIFFECIFYAFKYCLAYFFYSTKKNVKSQPTIYLMNNSTKSLLLHLLGIFAVIAATTLTLSAQPGGTNDGGQISPESIDIVKPYEPVLADAVRIEFQPDLPSVEDLNKNKKNFNDYYVPTKFMTIGYDPVPLKPIGWESKNKGEGKGDNEKLYHVWLRGGYGNYNTPYGDLSISSGASKKFNAGLQASYISSKDKGYDFKNYNRLGGRAYGKLFGKAFALGIEGGYAQDTYYYYGYDHTDTTLSYADTTLKQLFRTIGGGLNLSNTTENEAAIDYNAQFGYKYFFDRFGQKEHNISLTTELKKMVNERLDIKGRLSEQFSALNRDSSETDNLLNITPYVTYKATFGNLSGGATVLLDNGAFKPFPYIDLEFFVLPKTVTLFAGWNKEGVRNSYMALAGNNPFVGNSFESLNSLRENRYLGIKGSIGSVVSYSVKGYMNRTNQQPLYVNDSTDTKKFAIVYEPLMKTMGVTTELSARFSEKVAIGLQARFDKNTGTQETKMWHIPALNVRLRSEISPIKKLQLTTDFFVLDGNYGKLSDGTAKKLDTAIDLNVGAKFLITNNFGLFLTANNILSQQYERFLNYEVYGLNILGGLSLRF